MDSHWKELALQLDADDPLKWLPDHFSHPRGLYFDGNSLGLLSEESRRRVNEALDAWQNLAVTAWTEASTPWFTWVETVSDQIGTLIGAHPGEITLGASTTVMLHQLLATYYRPTKRRRKILIDGLAFPTDRYAVMSFLSRAAQSVPDTLGIVPPRGDRWLFPEDILNAADDSVALAILPSVVFSTGQLLPVKVLTDSLRDRGIMTIWDLSHSAGLYPHRLHDDAIDAAFFCTYKYLNGGPGAPGAAYIHQRLWPVVPGLQGWWGSHNSRQFHMPFNFEGANTSHALQLGTPSILSLAALAGSVELLTQAGIEAIYKRSQALVGLLESLLLDSITPLGALIITPPQHHRGGHLTVAHPNAKAIAAALRHYQVIPDFRPPDMVRLAPAPSTAHFVDLVLAVQVLERILREELWTAFQAPSSPVT